MSGTLADHGIHPLDDSESELGSYVDLERLLSGNSINLRDLGAVTDQVKTGLVFRSSQVVSPSQLKKLNIKTVIDLRQAPVTCKAHHHNMRQSISRTVFGAWMWLKHTVKRRCSRKLKSGELEVLLHEETDIKAAAPCWRCTDAGEAKYGVHAQVYHVDLLPGIVSIFIFAALPYRFQCKVIFLALKRKHPEPVVAAAVADPRIMGYLKLYKIILERSKRNLAAALRLLICEDHMPVLIHCIHGKDRTGLVVMLIYLLCGVPHDVIVKDYAQSESLLKEGRENRQLLGLPEEITTDEIIASAAHVMEATIEYLEQKYGDVEGYLRSAGMRQEEIEDIRKKLKDHSEVMYA